MILPMFKLKVQYNTCIVQPAKAPVSVHVHTCILYSTC